MPRSNSADIGSLSVFRGLCLYNLGDFVINNQKILVMKVTQIQWSKRNKIHVLLLLLMMICSQFVDGMTITNTGSATVSPSSGPANLVLSSASSYMNYQWYVNGVPWTGTSGTTSSLSTMSPALYWIEAEDITNPGVRIISNSLYIGRPCSTANYTNYTFTSTTAVATVTMDGVITVNPGVTLTLNGAIGMLYNSKIIVKPGATLNIATAWLTSCQRWKGIVVEAGGAINVTGLSRIEDAEVGIYSESPVYVDNSRFNFCKVSIALKGTTTPSTITNSCIFGYIYMAPPYCTISPSEPIYPYMTSNHFIDLRNCSGSDVINNSQFTGFAFGGNFPGFWTSRAIYLENTVNTDITANQFIDLMGYGVYITGSRYIEVKSTNTFNVADVWVGIGIFGSSHIDVTGNSFDANAAYGIQAENSDAVKIYNGNTFKSNNGVYLNKVVPYFVHQNTFNYCPYGVQSYNNDFQPAFRTIPPRCVISENTFNVCDHGVVIAPERDPFTNSTGLPNMMIGGQNIQYVLVSCNDFNTNIYALGVSGQLMDHYLNIDPANNFNSSVEWDIFSGMMPWQYYFNGPMPNSPPCALNPVMFNGPTIPNSSVMLLVSPIRYSDCAYEPDYFSPPPTAPVLLSVNEAPVETVYKVYPNPTAKTLTIEGVPQSSDYILTDASGRLISKGVTGSGATVLDVHELTDGFYLIKIKDKQGIAHTIRFVKAD
jgi:hypothetical protein